MKLLRESKAKADVEGVKLFEISCDSVPVQAAWVKETLGDDADSSAQVLSDFWPHGKVSRNYGVFNEERGMPVRSIFVIDQNAKIIHSEEFTQRGVLPDIQSAINIATDAD